MAVSHLSAEALSALCMQLHQLLQAGISPEEGLSILKEDTSDPEERALFERMSRAMEEGTPLSAALEAESVFPSYLVQMVGLGERTGNSDTVLHALSGYYDRERTLAESVKSAVIYPAIMAVMMTALLVVLSVFVLPAFSDVFSSLGLTLSPVATLLMGVGRILAPASAVVILVLLGAGAVIFAGWKQGKDTPVSRTVLARQISAGRFVSALALMLRSGLGVEESLERAATLTGRADLDAAGKNAARRVMEEGISLAEALGEINILSGFHLRMLRVGERAGRTDAMLEEVANRLAADTAARTDRLIARIEPTIVAVLALVAGLVLLSVMFPLLGILSAAG